MADKHNYELRVLTNNAKRIVEVVTLKDGNVQASISLTQEQAEHHAKTMIRAIEILEGNKAPESPIIKPGDPGFRVN